MKKNVLFALSAVPLGAIALFGCGGGSAVIGTVKSATLKGTANVPAGTPTRSARRGAGTDVPLPGATVKIYDVTTGGATAVNGAPVKTTTTLSDGTWAVSGLTPGDNYIVIITKTITGAAGSTVTLEAYAHTSSATVPTAVALTVNLSSTLAAIVIEQALTAEPTAASTDLTTVYSGYVATVDTQRAAGTLPTVDLTNPSSFTTINTQVASNSLKDAAFLDDGTGNTRRDLVNLMVSKTNSKVVVVLIVTDATGNVFDADYYAGALNADGTFGGLTTDGLYNIAGSVAGSVAHGAWSSVDGTLTGRWESTAAAGHTTTPAYRSVGYVGAFTKAGSTGAEGVWAFFVGANGNATMFAHDAARINITHLQRTAVVMGTVDSSGNVTGNMVFPVAPTNGAISGIDPAEGGSATGSGSASLTNHTVSGTVDVTGAITNDAVSGTWSFSGLRNGTTYARSGAWSGTTL